MLPASFAPALTGRAGPKPNAEKTAPPVRAGESRGCDNRNSRYLRMSASSNPAVRPDRIMEMVWGYAPPIILGTAIQCRVFDLLDGAPKTVDELAKASGNSARGLRAILNALVGFQ